MTNRQNRNNLPHLAETFMLTDGGLETTLIFHNGLELPNFAAFDLLRTVEGRNTLKDYYCRYAQMAIEHKRGFVLETPTWRASKDWADLMGYSATSLAAANHAAVELMEEVRNLFGPPDLPFLISGNIGPRGDGYLVENTMSVEEAEQYHSIQIEIFANSHADFVTALTINYVEEAIGIVHSAKKLDIPVVIAFTVETDGKLPSGLQLGDAIREVDAKTDNGPAYYMINCAHPDHFRDLLDSDQGWLQRISGVRANASRMSHAELDNSEVLDDGDPLELGAQYQELMEVLPNLKVMGGCCGTDHRHVEAISHACNHQHAAE